jgi:hypothetical protein
MENTESNPTPTLEGILSEEKEEVSEESKEETKETESAIEEKPTEDKGKDETAEPKKDELESRIQAEADKRVKGYQLKYETATATIRDLQGKLKEAQRQLNAKESDKVISAILSEDEENGLSQEETLNRKTALEKLNKNYQEYKEKSQEIEETSQVMSELSKGLDAKIVKEFGIDDPNPAIRAMNGMNLIKEAVATIQRNKAFAEVTEVILAKGSDVRKQIEGYVSELMNLSEDARGLKLKEIKQGFKITPKDVPLAPSGGNDSLNLKDADARTLIAKGLKKIK